MGAGTALPYVGRTVQRAVVAAAFREPGRIVVLSGEAGVGKSSLVALERAAAVTDVIEGSCLQLAGQALPLGGLGQIFDARGGGARAAGGAGPQAARERPPARPGWGGAPPPPPWPA